MYYFRTENEAFKVLLSMGYICKQKEVGGTYLLKWGVPTYENGGYLPTKIGGYLPTKMVGTYLGKLGVHTY